MNKSLILNDIKTHLGFKTDTDFADFLGIKQNTLSNWKSRNTIDYELIITKCDDINANWLLTGEGEMLKKNMLLMKTGEPNEGLPLIPIEAMAGYGTGSMQIMDYDTSFYVVPEFTELKA